jgi:NADPH:quinone reductase-like Zn-dependent oxidoreductase
MVTQLARQACAYVIGTGRAADRQQVLDFGAKEFVDLADDPWESTAVNLMVTIRQVRRIVTPSWTDGLPSL